jgi:hypothetical protein
LPIKTQRLDKSHLTPREKGIAMGFVTLALLLITGGGGYDIYRVGLLPSVVLASGFVVLLVVMLWMGAIEESRTPK